MNDKIRKLQDEISKETEKINSCSHEFGESYYNPGTKSVPYGSKTIVQGSDIWSAPEGYRDEHFARWSKKCCKCGFEKHTTRKKPIITDYEPDFE